jgi:hypothetical protein
MGDEDGGQQLPQRARGAARAGPFPSAPPVLSEKLRQRLQAAVAAERVAAAPPDDPAPADPAPAEPAPPTTRSGPGGNGISRRPSAPPVLSEELRQRLQAAVAAERAAAAPHDDGAPAEPPTTRSGQGGNGISRPLKPAVKPEPVRPDPVKPDPAANRAASHEPAAVPPQAGPSPQHEASGRKKPVRRRLVAALVVIVAAALGIAVSLYYVRAPAAGQGQDLTSRDQAATWVAQQVNHGANVACDQLMCSALAADGFPSRNLRVLGPTAQYPVTSAVVVVTAAVRHIFGTSLSSYWAPAVLATFGSGSAEISVRVVAPHGAAAYETAASADLTAREAAGDALLKVSDVVASAAARKQLMAGQVDSRLLLALADLAADRPVDIVDFGNIAPGEDPDIPLRVADLAVNDQAAGPNSSAYVRSVVADLGAVIIQFRPASTKTAVLAGGQKVLRVQFTAPSPLGLLGS